MTKNRVWVRRGEREGHQFVIGGGGIEGREGDDYSYDKRAVILGYNKQTIILQMVEIIVDDEDVRNYFMPH